MENRDYQKIAKVVGHKKFGKVWELEKDQHSFESNGNQYAIRGSNSFFLAENYPTFTELYYNDFSNSFVLGNKKSENSLLVASIYADRGVKFWDVQSGPLKGLLTGKQLVLKNGNDVYDANNYAIGKIFVLDKLTMSTMVAGDDFKVAMMLDDGRGGGVKTLLKTEFTEDEISKVQLLHVEGAEGEEENQNSEEAQKTLELINALGAEGVEPSNIGIVSPYKNQVLLYEQLLKRSVPSDNIFLSNTPSVPKKFEYMIFSITAFTGNALLLKNIHMAVKKMLKYADTLIIVGNIEFLFEKNQHLNTLLQSAYENGQVIEL